MDDLTQSQVRSLEQEAQALKKELQALLARLEAPARGSEPAEALPGVREALQKGCFLLERLEPAIQALHEDIARTRRERNQLSTLYEISQALNSTLSLAPLLELVMDRLIAVTRAERGFITLLDAPSGELRFAVARNMDRTTVEGRDFQVSRGVIERVAREGQPVLTDNAGADPRFADRESVICFGLRSIMAAPLRVRERLLGVVYVDNRIQTGIFSREDLDLLVAFANQAAIAIENARLFDDLQRTLREITEIKSYMEDIFASVDSGILTTDLTATITTCNRAAEAIFGLPIQEARGRRFQELFEDRSGRELASAVFKAIKDETRLRDYEVSCALPRRGQVTLKLQVSPLKDARRKTIGAAMVVEDLTEERRLQQTLNRYLAPSVVQEALRMAETGQFPLGGTRRVMSILFADVRGFTSFSERVAPEELVDILNAHLTVAARAILEQGGTLDKFMGDAVMALFNVPVPQPDHVLRAVRAAWEMQRRIAALGVGDRPTFRFGVGIHVGEAVAGNIGSPERLDYTAIGDAVNLAKRLQENAKGGQILLSAPAYREVAPWVEVRPLGAIYVKGREEPVEVYELLGLKEGAGPANASA
ncbi:MAG: adenylate/guanylate cyclase domain-containing protein [Chloroflexia bacterium]